MNYYLQCFQSCARLSVSSNNANRSNNAIFRVCGMTHNLFAETDDLQVSHIGLVTCSTGLIPEDPPAVPFVVEVDINKFNQSGTTEVHTEVPVYRVYDSTGDNLDLWSRDGNCRGRLWDFSDPLEPRVRTVGCLYVTIPKCVHEVGIRCFTRLYNCRHRVVFEAPSKLERICSEAFLGTRIESIAIPDSVVELGEKCFYSCWYLCRVTFGRSSKLERICREAFRWTSIESIAIPDSVVKLGNRCFFECTLLRLVIFGESPKVERFGTLCFGQSGLRSFTIPPSITQLRGNIFEGCKHFCRVAVHDDCDFAVCGSLIINKLESVIHGALSVRQVVIPASVVGISEKCFYWASTLESVLFDPLTSLDRIPAKAFAGTGVKSVVVPESVVELGSYCLDACHSLESVTFGASSRLERIGKGAFFCTGLRSVAIPDCVVELCDECFALSLSLVRVTFGMLSALERIGTNAFHGNAIESVPSPGSVIELPFICDD